MTKTYIVFNLVEKNKEWQFKNVIYFTYRIPHTYSHYLEINTFNLKQIFVPINLVCCVKHNLLKYKNYLDNVISSEAEPICTFDYGIVTFFRCEDDHWFCAKKSFRLWLWHQTVSGQNHPVKVGDWTSGSGDAVAVFWIPSEHLHTISENWIQS